MKKETKTNAMRILESMNIGFKHLEYDCSEFTDGTQMADNLGVTRETLGKLERGQLQNPYYRLVYEVAAVVIVLERLPVFRDAARRRRPRQPW